MCDHQQVSKKICTEIPHPHPRPPFTQTDACSTLYTCFLVSLGVGGGGARGEGTITSGGPRSPTHKRPRRLWTTARTTMLTPSLPCNLKTSRKSAKFETQAFSFSFSRWHVKGFIKMHITVNRFLARLETVLFLRRFRASFSLEILQAGAKQLVYSAIAVSTAVRSSHKDNVRGTAVEGVPLDHHPSPFISPRYLHQPSVPLSPASL